MFQHRIQNDYQLSRTGCQRRHWNLACAWKPDAPSPAPSPSVGRGARGYDATGNLLTTTNPKGETTTIAYNQFGQPTSVTDPLNQTTSFAYDAQGNLITTADPLSNATQRTYDTVSRLIALTDPRSATTNFSYDPLNRVTQITDARNALTGFGYDPSGNLLSVADAKSQATAYTYDTMDRLATRTDALNRVENYQYDPAGNLQQVTDRKNQTATFTYDSLNRRTGASYADGSSTAFTYDSVGRLAVVADSVSGTIQYIYDNLDQLVQEITPQGSVQYAYDALGRRTSMTVSGQPPVTYQYDAASRLTQVAQGALVVTIGYDAAGRRTSLTYPNGTSTAYTYDAASRLTNILHQGPGGVIESLTYTYDAAGNRLSVNRLSGTATALPNAATASYDAANEQIQFAGATLTYDQNGNLTNDGTNTYTWDARNRLVSITGGVSASFTYDSLGRRTSKTVNGVTTIYLYDGNDIVQESGASGLATYLRSLNIDEPFIRQSSSNEYYHTDALGTVLALTGQTGAVQTSYNYEAFGKTTITGSSTNPFQYTGRENDGTGLYYFRARYYSSTLQRFISEDPLGIKAPGGDLNFYSYVLNNPIDGTDPSGLYYLKQSGDPPPLLPTLALSVLLTCMDDCYGSPLVVTSTSETLIKPRKGKVDWHAFGFAADIAYPSSQKQVDKILCCASQCGAAYGKEENKAKGTWTQNTTGNNIHISLFNTNTGSKGDLPLAPQKCGCK